MKQAVDKLDYPVTFNRSISQAMARTMQDLSEGVFRRVACNQPTYQIDVSDVRLSVHIFRFRTLTQKRFVQSNSNLTGR